ncbi:hypothetical protein HDU87_000953 [Geranomyces variabilis]|uniref:Oxidoreductase n=1 Tax=Geranomyces variabilis TaxID=109894 RepID=A0AAD5XNL0_9FUNG|nr:hypothetical protein HDU87_000953 [Geranomyces variabilis]
MPLSILVVGATRGLGAALATAYAKRGETVYATARAASSHASDEAPKGSNNIQWVHNIDLMDRHVGASLVAGLKGLERPPKILDVVIITAGFFKTEDFEKGPNWDDQVKMYTTSSIAPTFLVHSLYHSGSLLKKGAKIVLVSSESGSITLRHKSEGGGNYGHHASKAALNMVGKLLSLDLADAEVIVSIVHPGFMRTQMTKDVGYDKAYDAGGAVSPDVAAASLVEWVAALDMSKTGEYWAPRGPNDIGTADVVLGQEVPTPLRLPW